MVDEDVTILINLASREPFMFPQFSFSILCLNFFSFCVCVCVCVLHHVLWCKYTTQTKEKYNFIN